MFALVFSTLALTGAAPVPKEDDIEKALKAIQGKWKTVAAEEKGEAGKPEDFDLQTIKIDGKVLVEIDRRGKETLRYQVALSPSKSPAHLDLIWLDEKGKPTPLVAHAIYKLEGGRLTICFGSMKPDEPDNRPREFKSGPSEQRPQKGKLMYTFERVKE
jgi:uncharacterized protein (TIGR03067 family)